VTRSAAMARAARGIRLRLTSTFPRSHDTPSLNNIDPVRARRSLTFRPENFMVAP